MRSAKHLSLPGKAAAFLSPLALMLSANLPASAQEAAATPAVSGGDTAWMLTSTALVLMMTIPGLALFYAGLVRKKSVLATAMQSFATTCLVAVLWTIVGYSLAFTNGDASFGAYVGDLSRMFSKGMDMTAPFSLGAGGPASAVATTIPESVFMMFQMTFAIITPALIAGAFADRMKFSAMLWFMALWSLIVYAPIAHSVWQPNGFLFTAGVLDFAGGTVVHINAGVAGLVCAIVLGKRLGYPLPNAKPYNTLLCLVGASLLWVGWFGFNAGSALAANGRAGMAMAVTMIAAAVCGLVWMLIEWKMRGKPSIPGVTTGAVAGLVAITPASGFVDPMGAIWIGIAAAVLCFFASTTIKGIFKYDDSLDAFGVHGVGGFIGALLTGVFATSAVTGDPKVAGLIDGNAAQVMIQLEGIGATIAWSAIGTLVILMVLKATIGIRVSAAQEMEGLDLSQHDECLHDADADQQPHRNDGKMTA